ncbi:23493_t:CDS:2, partial [Racocetra persica]
IFDVLLLKSNNILSDMRNKHIYLKTLLILFAFILQNGSMVRAQLEPFAKLWGVENEKVPELLDREAKLIKIDGKLQPLLNNSYFGGTYIDVKANKININTVDQSKVKEYELEANNVVIYLKDKNDPKNKEFINGKETTNQSNGFGGDRIFTLYEEL